MWQLDVKPYIAVLNYETPYVLRLPVWKWNQTHADMN